MAGDVGSWWCQMCPYVYLGKRRLSYRIPLCHWNNEPSVTESNPSSKDILQRVAEKVPNYL